MAREITVDGIKIGGHNPIVLIAGPCVIESAQSAYRHARAIKAIASRANIPFIYKSSYDKANRTSIKSYRGPGLKKGLATLKRIRQELNCPVLSDVHSTEEIPYAAKVLDIIQIPAFLCRQTDLILEAAKTGKVINIKKGQFLAPWDMKHIIKKIESAGNRKIIVTERGYSFGYNNLVSDFRSILIMKGFGYPVVYDASHSVQMPGGFGDRSGGDGRFIPGLSMAAAACGADAIFVETHEDPERAMSDGPNMLRLSDLEEMVLKVDRISAVVRQ